MFKNVLVGVDDRDGGRDAIALGEKLRGHGGELTLAHVYSGDPYLGDGPPGTHDAAERQHIAAFLEEARREAGVEANLRWCNAPSVGSGLHELCELIDSDLLVVGSSRRGVVGRVLLGDGTHAALNGVPCAVAIAPSGYRQHPAAVRRIGVAYDGSPESEHALAVARVLASEAGATLSALQVVSLPSSALGVGGESLGDAMRRLVDDAHSRVAALGDVEPHVEYGIASEELTVYSASLDLLVVGSRGYGPLGRLVHGSTSGSLSRSARCPLLVLPRGAAVTATADGSGRAMAETGAIGA